MNDAVTVRFGKCVGDLTRDGETLCQRQRRALEKAPV